MSEEVYGDAYDELLGWLYRGVDHLDAKDATEALDTWAKIVRKDMAHELAEWIRTQARALTGYSNRSKWIQLADKIDPDKVPSKNGLRSYWNQEEWNS